MFISSSSVVVWMVRQEVHNSTREKKREMAIVATKSKKNSGLRRFGSQIFFSSVKSALDSSRVTVSAVILVVRRRWCSGSQW